MAHSIEKQGLIRKLHVAKREMALTDDSYQAILVRITGKDSSRVMTVAELDAVMREFKRLGFSAKPKVVISDKLHVRKVFAIWTDMAPLLRDPSRTALRSFVKRQTGVDDPNFLDVTQAGRVTEALKAWSKRERAKQMEAADG
jgi:phage gp16-like protein